MTVIDLTLTIREGMTTYPKPWHPFVEVSQLGRIGIEGRETRKLILGTHTGTHIDAPRHFISGGMTVDEIPLSQINGIAHLVDLTKMIGQRVEKESLISALSGRVPERVLLRFDWDKYIDNIGYYSNHPYLSPEAAQWLIDNGCGLIGMDTPMPDLSGDETMRIHKRLLGQDVVILEYLTNLSSIPRDMFQLIVAPLKIAGGDGAPARVFAIT